ncbi:recombinase family protein [Sphingopyxis granuli]|uniref:recombinase family protein n=1 Tax=Sphingopyxis granuli TaxID=267128 RepID=UPI001F52B90A|nr:recombinase family protein [Sphingopyxis granuli]UNK80666.1 recombinase family protein [Sphingopyxis granuli]
MCPSLLGASPLVPTNTPPPFSSRLSRCSHLDCRAAACEAYILSQRHEGWTLVPGRYDDGGFSGGNMERPGLKTLLADIDGGQVDVIVVYKVDRLTRSLADFAKIVERLDAREASFVSVTQAFNTTTSMGRLTLNVLLSFAQFEREVTGERIRDKIAASKRKGLWMGGPVPLGYQVVERKLVPVPEEAERVRTIMRRYLEIRNVPALIEILRAEGVVTKVQNRVSGPHRGGIPFARGSLFYLLKNPVYRGKIVHKGKVYDGEHEAIVDEKLWDAVQTHLAEKAPPRKRPKNDRNDAIFNGMIADPEGRPVVPTYSTKGTRRYSFYETRKDLARPGDPPATRFQQGAFERQVSTCIADLLADEHALRRLSNISEAGPLRSMFEQANNLVARLLRQGGELSVLRSVVRTISIRNDHLEVTLDPATLGVPDQSAWTIQIPRPTRRPFREARLRLDAASPGHSVNAQLVTLISDALEVQGLVLTSPHLSLNQLAKSVGRCRKQMAKLLNLSWLSPRIVEAIIKGSQPRGLTRTRLLEADLPLSWSDQEAMLGCAA